METTKRYRATGLDQALKDQGRMREWIAAKANVHASLITHLIAGRRTVSEEVATKISKALGFDDLSVLFELSYESIVHSSDRIGAAA